MEGIKAVKKSLDSHPKQTVATKVITTYLVFILTLSNFIFNCRNYLQTKGCAMGTICALRFIGYIFFIWTGNKKDLMKILNDLNTKRESIKFEYQISKTSIAFVDNQVCIKNNKLYIKIYRKKIVKHSSTSTLNTLNL